MIRAVPQSPVPCDTPAKSSPLATSVQEIETSSSLPASHALTEQLKSNTVVVLSVSPGEKRSTVRYVVRCGGRFGSWHLRKEAGLCDFDPALHLVTVCQNGRLGFRSSIADGKLLRCDRDFCLTFASWQLGSQEAWSLRGYSLSDCVLWHNKHKLALNVCITILAEPGDSLGNIHITFDARGNTEVEASNHSPPSAVSTVTEWSQMRERRTFLRSFSLKSDVVVSKDHVMETATGIHVSAENSPSGQRRKLQSWSWSRKRELDNGEIVCGTARYDDHQTELKGGLLDESISGSDLENPVEYSDSPCLAQSQNRSGFLEQLVREVESSPSRLEKPKLSESQLLAFALEKVRDYTLTKEKEKDLRWKLQAAVLVLKSLTKQKLELMAQNARLEAGNKVLKEERDRDLQLLLTELSRLRTELWVTRIKTERGQAGSGLQDPRPSTSYQMVRKSMAVERDTDLQGSGTSTGLQDYRLKPFSQFSRWAYLPIPLIALAYVASFYRKKAIQNR